MRGYNIDMHTNRRLLQEEEGSGEEVVLGIVIAFLVALAIRTVAGLLPKRMRDRIPLPYTAILLLSGIAVGSIVNKAGAVDYATDAVRELESIAPSVLFTVFLPALIMPSGLALDWHVVRLTLDKSLLLAFPGTLFNAILIAIVVRYVLPYGWSWSASLLLASILAATDPVAVVSIMESASASVKLSTIVNGESLLNDGVAFVLFQIFSRWAGGVDLSAGWIIGFLFKAVLGSPALGIAWGLGLTAWILFMYGDNVAEVAATLAAAYSLWIVTDAILSMSGVLAVVSFSVLFGTIGKIRISSGARTGFVYFWQFVDWTANSLIFFLSGLIIAIELDAIGSEVIQAKDWGYAVLLWVLLLAIRAVMAILFFPLLRLGSYGMSRKDAVVLAWAGLRGAVGLTLALTVYLSPDIQDSEYRGKQFFFVAFMAFITLMIQGSTTSLLLKMLGYFDLSSIQRNVMKRSADVVTMVATNHVKRAQDRSSLLSGADWDKVKRFTDLKISEYIDQRPQRKEKGIIAAMLEHHEDEIDLSAAKEQVLVDIRQRLLCAVMSQYRYLLSIDSIDGTLFGILVGITSKALDCIHEPLKDWRFLEEQLACTSKGKGFLHFNTFIGLFQRHRRRMGRDAYLAASFAFAHANARKELQAFIDLEVGGIVQEEKENSERNSDKPQGIDKKPSMKKTENERTNLLSERHSEGLGDALRPFWSSEEDEQQRDNMIINTSKQLGVRRPSMIQRVATKARMEVSETTKCLETVFNESLEEQHAAESFVSMIEKRCPDAIRDVRTIKECMTILRKQQKLLEEMERQGVLEEREFGSSMETIERRMKTLHFKIVTGR